MRATNQERRHAAKAHILADAAWNHLLTIAGFEGLPPQLAEQAEQLSGDLQRFTRRLEGHEGRCFGIRRKKRK